MAVDWNSLAESLRQADLNGLLKNCTLKHGIRGNKLFINSFVFCLFI